MEQAIISILDENDSELEYIDVQFNPSDYSVTQSTKYTQDKPIAQGENAQQFVSVENASFKVKLTLDGFDRAKTIDPEDASDICDDLKFFRRLVTVDEELHKPPRCRFSWGSFTFTGYAENLGINYSMFSSSGRSIRATVDLTLVNTERKDKALRSPDRTRRRVLMQDTPLYMVAYEAYNDPSQWRRIAIANDIKNPRRLEAGMVLKVPPVTRDSL